MPLPPAGRSGRGGSVLVMRHSPDAAGGRHGDTVFPLLSHGFLELIPPLRCAATAGPQCQPLTQGCEALSPPSPLSPQVAKVG